MIIPKRELETLEDRVAKLEEAIERLQQQEQKMHLDVNMAEDHPHTVQVSRK